MGAARERPGPVATPAAAEAIDVHQHLWPEPLLDALRRRRRPPRLDGWRLHLDGEPDCQVDPRDHDVARRVDTARVDDGLTLALVSISSPLGIEWLPPEESHPLLDAYHDGALDLPEPFGAWAAACLSEIDPAGCEKDLDRGFAGLQLPATALLDAAGYDRCAPLLELLELRGKPLFIHPGAAPPVSPTSPGSPTGPAGPGWWPALVPYVHQMHTAWYAFGLYGRPRHPNLRVCFAMLAGLAPLHRERFSARGGGRAVVDTQAFVETSSYGPRAVDATVRELGIDVIVAGSDYPYATLTDPLLGAAATHAIRSSNPLRLLAPASKGDRP